MLTDNEIIKIRKTLKVDNKAIVFKALGDPNRYSIVEILAKHPELTVTDISKILSISVPLASQHLKVLENAKILKKEKGGQMRYLKLNHANQITKSLITEIL